MSVFYFGAGLLPSGVYSNAALRDVVLRQLVELDRHVEYITATKKQIEAGVDLDVVDAWRSVARIRQFNDETAGSEQVQLCGWVAACVYTWAAWAWWNAGG